MKVQKIIAGVFALTLFVSAVCSVSAANNVSIAHDANEMIEVRDMDQQNMQEDFSKLTNNRAGYMYYHAGSFRPYDDVFAYSETKVTSGMNGYAGVFIMGENNVPSAKYSERVVDNSYIRTDNAMVASCNTAKRVVFSGARREAGSYNYKGFNYTIH